jgi:hypothetical protein
MCIKMSNHNGVGGDIVIIKASWSNFSKIA